MKNNQTERNKGNGKNSVKIMMSLPSRASDPSLPFDSDQHIKMLKKSLVRNDISLVSTKQEKNSTVNTLNLNTNQNSDFENAIQARLGSSDFKTVKPTLIPTVVRFKDRIRTQKANSILKATLNIR